MSSTEVDCVIDQLSKATVDGSSELSFAGKGLKLDGESDAQQIVDAIASFGHLQALRLEGNTLGIEAARCIAQALENHPEFERALWSDMFTGRLKTEIPDALRYLGNGIITAGARLVELDLSDNAFGPNGMNGLTDFLVSRSCYSLKELRLHNNGLGITGGKMLAKCLLECHKSSAKLGTPLALRVFVSGRGRLENEGAIALAEAFKAMGSLEEVQMPQNGINHLGITALAEAFAVNKNLRHLNLQDNTFTKVGAASMAKALPCMQNLEVLNFGDCLLRNKGALVIAKALRSRHRKLQDVQFSFNEMKPSGACAIADALSNNDKLKRLDLDGNEFGEDCIEQIRSQLGDKADALGSFSDDEGTGDEADESVGEEGEEEEGGEEVDDPALQVQGLAITPRSQPPVLTVSTADFLAFPSPTKLQGLGKDRARNIVTHLGDGAKDIDKVLNTFMKVASTVTAEDEKTRLLACECADELLSVVLMTSDENISSTFSNALLVHLGILKSEDKKFHTPSNINGAVVVLDHVVQQSYFPKACKGFLQVFLGKPHQLLESCSKSRSKLLQTLYTF